MGMAMTSIEKLKQSLSPLRGGIFATVMHVRKAGVNVLSVAIVTVDLSLTLSDQSHPPCHCDSGVDVEGISPTTYGVILNQARDSW
jgi:hypothetical protein